MKKGLISVGLPSVIVFLYLFYLTWAVPVNILSREYSINSYFIFNNFFVWLTTGLSVLYAFILYLSYHKSHKLYQWILIITLGFISASTIYPYLLAYSYGYFDEAILLTPKESLRGFSKFYYLLDFILLGSMFGLAYQSVKKNIQLQQVILLIFYLLSNVQILLSLNITTEVTRPSSIILSNNNPNVIVFIPDSSSPLATVDFLTNSYYQGRQKYPWVNNFTFFDDLITPHTGSTIPSLPYIIGGKEFSVEKQIDRLWNHQGRFQYHGTGLEKMQEILGPSTHTAYNYIHTDNLSPTRFATGTKEINTPILAVSLYDRIPYFLRIILSKNHGYGWRDKTFFSYKWVVLATEGYSFFTKTTTGPTLNYIHTHGSHEPFFPEILSPNLGEQAVITNYYSSVNYTFDTINNIVNTLKENKIYDTSKIIVTPDHGVFKDPTYLELANEAAFFIYESTNLAILASIPSFLMIKDFNSKITNFNIDSRVLSGLDIHEITALSLTNIEGYVDYTKVIPPKREFNIMLMWWPFIVYLDNPKTSWSDNHNTEFFKKGYNTVLYEYGHSTGEGLGYIKLKSTKEIKDTNIYYQELTNIINLPAYNIVE